MRRTPLAKVSRKRLEQAADYDRAVQKAFSRDNFACVARTVWPEISCSGQLHPHHVYPQGVYPELRCVESNIRVLCSAHHFGVHHVSPGRARALGLLK